MLQDPQTVRVSSGATSADTSVTATSATLPLVNDWKPASGRFFADADNARLAAVAVLGQRASQKLFGKQNPLGKELQIGQSVFAVIGVMAEKGANPSGFDLDDVVLVPFDTARARLGRSGHAEFMMVKISDASHLEGASRKIERALEVKRGRSEVVARSLSTIIDAQLQARDTLTLLLGSLAFISLVVSTVGITNITLVSLIERTREIGLRKALGATERDIMVMVIAETGIISLLGGLLGVGLGLMVVMGMRFFGIPAQGVFAMPAIATFISLFLGIAAGAYPARRAARMNPIQALISL